MENIFYEFGYDTLGRQIVVDGNGNYVTHIPCNMTPNEVMARVYAGTMIPFDGANQGMQNIPGAHSYGTEVALREDWPMHEAWQRRWFELPDDEMTFEEFEAMWRAEHPTRH